MKGTAGGNGRDTARRCKRRLQLGRPSEACPCPPAVSQPTCSSPSSSARAAAAGATAASGPGSAQGGAGAGSIVVQAHIERKAGRHCIRWQASSKARMSSPCRLTTPRRCSQARMSSRRRRVSPARCARQPSCSCWQPRRDSSSSSGRWRSTARPASAPNKEGWEEGGAGREVSQRQPRPDNGCAAWHRMAQDSVGWITRGCGAAAPHPAQPTCHPQAVPQVEAGEAVQGGEVGHACTAQGQREP